MTKIKIKSNVKDVANFINKVRNGTVRKKALKMILDTLLKVLDDKIYNNTLKVYNVANSSEMRALIKSGGKPTEGRYDPNYLVWKKHNAPNAHEVSGRLKANTFIEIINDKVLFYIPTDATTRTCISTGLGNSPPIVHFFNFGPIHERRKSILKATIIFAWQEIMRKIALLYDSETR